MQGIQPELQDIAERYETKFTTTTFIVSSSQTSPDDLQLCVSVATSEGQTPHIVIVKRKASKRCGCQVFYYREGINWWKITYVFFPEHFFNVSFMPGIYMHKVGIVLHACIHRLICYTHLHDLHVACMVVACYD